MAEKQVAMEVEGQSSLPPPSSSAASSASASSASSAQEIKHEEVKVKPREVTEEVTELQTVLGAPIHEKEMKAIYNRYLGKAETWDSVMLRKFLLDLQQAKQCPRVVSDEMLSDILAEFQLNPDENGRVSWIEFRSFFILQSVAPLTVLHERMRAMFSPADVSRALLVLNLPPATTKEHVMALFSATPTNAVFFARDESGVQALVVLKDEAQVATALAKNGADVLGSKVVVSAFRIDIDEFPLHVEPHSPSMVARGLATSYVYGKKAVATLETQWQHLDQKYALSAKAKTAATSVQESAKKIDQEYKVTERVSAAAHVAGEAAQKAATAVDEKLHVKENVKKAKDALMANETVKAGLAWAEGLATRFGRKVTEVERETKVLVAEKEKANAASSPASASSSAPSASSSSASSPSSSSSSSSPSSSAAPSASAAASVATEAAVEIQAAQAEANKQGNPAPL